MTRAARVAGLLALTWILTVILAVAACAGNPQALTVSDLIKLEPEEHRRVLQEGMEQGQILYVKGEQHKSAPSGNLPQRLVKETWLGAGSDGTIGPATTTLHLPDGPETMETMAAYGATTVDDWLGQAWQLSDWAERAGAEFKGRGNLHGWESLIYEWSTDTQVQRLEIVEDAPLIARESALAIDRHGALTLTQSNTVLEYRLLPPGIEAPAVNRN